MCALKRKRRELLGLGAYKPRCTHRRGHNPGADADLAHLVFKQRVLRVGAVPAVEVRRPGSLEERLEDGLESA